MGGNKLVTPSNNTYMKKLYSDHFIIYNRYVLCCLEKLVYLTIGITNSGI